MATTNARLELADALWNAGASILAAEIDFGSGLSFTLPPVWSREDYFNFSRFMDHQYDSGYGSQNLHGTVWLTDGSWLERGEYDGKEWWEHRKCPPVPQS